jgi:hypothetical protein
VTHRAVVSPYPEWIANNPEFSQLNSHKLELIPTFLMLGHD